MRLFSLLFVLFFFTNSHAANLLEVYHQAQNSDPVFQQAVAQRMATKEGVPISLSALLPAINISANPSITRSGFSGTNFSKTSSSTPGTISPRNNTQRAYTLSLTVTQTVFDFSRFSALSGQVALSKGADATLNAALQNLMARVVAAYFAILRDEETVNYTNAAQHVYKKQLQQAQQQYEVGLKTLTDVYAAKAAHASAIANHIAAQTQFTNDKENLRAITGIDYPNLASLNKAFPLTHPQPADSHEWVKTAVAQNWTIKTAQYAVDAARQTIRQQFAGHLPTLNLQGTLDRNYVDNINGYTTLDQRNGPGTQTDRSIMLTLSVPLFSGGGVVAQTNQATYQYQIAQQQLEQTIRMTTTTTRQSYSNILSGISKIKADQQAILASQHALTGMEAGYHAGTETLVNVLNQQQKLLEAQIQYATDRYAFINYVIALKQAAGTLSFEDLQAINTWLSK